MRSTRRPAVHTGGASAQGGSRLCRALGGVEWSSLVHHSMGTWHPVLRSSPLEGGVRRGGLWEGE